MLSYLTFNDFHSMGNGRQYDLKTFSNRFRATWQVNNKAPSPDNSGGSTQHRHRCFVQGLGSHSLSETRHNLIRYGECRFRSNITLLSGAGELTLTSAYLIQYSIGWRWFYQNDKDFWAALVKVLRYFGFVLALVPVPVPALVSF